MRGAETSFTFESESLSYIFQKEIKPIRRGTRWRGEGEHLKQKEKKNEIQRPSFILLAAAPPYNFLAKQ